MQRKNLDVDPANRKNPFPFASNKQIYRTDIMYCMVYWEDTPKLYLEFVIYT